MAVSFTRFPCWLWGNNSNGSTRAGSKEKEPVSSNGSSLNSSTEWGFGLNSSADTIKFSTRISSSAPRKARKKKWQSREQRRIDREYDLVVVPSDGVCLSGSESDDSDWSIGWLEPHGPEFNSDDDENDNSFAVLVPCYRPGCKEVVEGSNNNQLLSAIKNLPNPEGKNYMEEWLSSLRNF